jgi:Peptidase family C25
MKRSIFLLFFSVFLNFSYAQSGNEWIKFSQEYYKISTARDAIYRLSFSDLQSAGFPVTTTDPRTLQLFHRGLEQDIRVFGESDGIFDPGDYIEFYGTRNDGTGDAVLYSQATAQPNRYYNLYGDTTSYFLTFDPLLGQSSHRMDSVTEFNTTNIPKETYHYDEKLLILSDIYSGGYTENEVLTSTDFLEGEGWTGLSIPNGQYKEYEVSGITNGYQPAGAPQIELQVLGWGPQAHQFEVAVGGDASSLRHVVTQTFSGFATPVVSQPLDWNDIGSNGKIVVRISTLGDAAGYDPVSLSYVKVRYPQTTTAGTGDKFFRLRPNPTNKSYLEIQGLPVQALLFDVTDPAHTQQIKDPFAAVIPGTALERTLLAAINLLTPPIHKVSFTPIEPNAYNYIIISHSSLMKPALGYSDVVQAFADYRASEAGGSFQPLVVDIHQLYDQFNYGEISPIAIRRFMEYLATTNLPRYLFIIGEGLDIWYNYYRKPQQFTAIKCLVPTAGYPGSDAFFTFNMAGATDEPAVPTGRITAMKAEEVAAYLNKVKEMESLPYDQLWRKNVLHLSGGIHPGEPERFKSYVQGFQKIAEGLHFGGSVKSIAKQSTNPVEFVNIRDEVNKGLDLITFYGHSASSVIDFDIGFVTDPKLGFDNRGKYPMFLINGCNAGAFFINAKLFGEDWINAANKGAVGFIAHTSYGLEFGLKRYSDIFYQVAYGDSIFIQKGIGDIQKEVARRYMLGAPRTVSNLSQVQQMVLLGDPAVRLFGAKKPDYEIQENNVFIESFDENPVTAFSDSIALRMIIPNYGMAKEDTLRIRVTRTFSDQTSITYDSLFGPVLYSDTLTFVLRKENAFGAGSNAFTVELDPDNEIPELNENNNTVSFNYFVSLNRTKNLFPHDFAIVSGPTVNLTFQTTDLMSDSREYVLEVDTLNTFDSPFKSSYSIQGGVLNKKEITLLDNDSLTYYWRTRFADPAPGESAGWEMNSFSFIQNGPEGWAQMHFPQYLKNQSVGLVKDPVLRQLGFEETVTSVYINNFGSGLGNTRLDVSVKLNGNEYQINTQSKACRNSTINLIAFDRVSTTPYAPVPIKFQDYRTCGRQPQVINSFLVSEFYGVDPDTGEPAGIKTAVDNVYAGDSVVLFSIGDPRFSIWPSDVKVKLQELGISAAQLNSIQDGEPVVIFGKKGIAPGSAKVYLSDQVPANQQSLEVNASVTGRYTSGNMTSTLIGPAQEWHSLFPKIGPSEPNDETSIDVLGVQLDGNKSLLMDGINSTIDLSGIDAATYPYLRLVYRTQDDLNLTATQLNNWIVTYTTMAEGLLFYQGEPEPVVLPEGQFWAGMYGFVNISDKAFPDSLEVRQETFNKTNRVASVLTQKIKSPGPGDTTLFVSTVQTLGKVGLNDVEVYVNPRIVPEQQYENNLLRLFNHLTVEADRYRPVLEVTVDGRALMDGDFVSSDPAIKIRLWDENRTVLKTDTTGVKIFLEYPCSSGECDDNPSVHFSRADVRWLPASDTSDFTIYFDPENLPEGDYRLTIEAGDARENTAAPDPYSITFKVKYESSVVLLAPYPNPSFGTVTFTLIISGEDAPDHFAVQIFGVNGKMVREIDAPGDNIFVGTNEINWDSTDDQGYHLPSGLYPYRIILRRQGKDIPIKVPVNTSYFRGGYGKIVLIH